MRPAKALGKRDTCYMKSHLLLPSVALALACTVFSDPGSRGGGVGPETKAGDYADAAMPLPDPGSIRREFFGVISAVKSEERVIVVDDRSLGSQSLHVDSRTRMTQGDKNASWNDLRVGATVNGVCIGSPGNSYAEIVNIGR
jgi:hypothetical protein